MYIIIQTTFSKTLSKKHSFKNVFFLWKTWCTYSHGIIQGNTDIISAISLNDNIFCQIDWPTRHNLKQGIENNNVLTATEKSVGAFMLFDQIMLKPTCVDIRPTSRRVYVSLAVMLLKVAREAWTKSSAVVSLRGRRAAQPRHRSSVDSICH